MKKSISCDPSSDMIQANEGKLIKILVLTNIFRESLIDDNDNDGFTTEL